MRFFYHASVFVEIAEKDGIPVVVVPHRGDVLARPYPDQVPGARRDHGRIIAKADTDKGIDGSLFRDGIITGDSLTVFLLRDDE